MGKMTEKMQTDDVLSRQAVFARCCLKLPCHQYAQRAALPCSRECGVKIFRTVRVFDRFRAAGGV